MKFIKRIFSIFFVIFLFFPYLLTSAEQVNSSQGTRELTDLTIEELMSITVRSASTYEQKVTEAPSSVTIITAGEIKKYGYRTLAEILRSVRGFYTTYDRNYIYVGIRGFARPGDYNTRFLLLVDGHRINENVFDMATIGTDFIMDVDLIDRVEVIRGPSSSLYGSNAFLGVINVITKKGEDFRGIEVSGAAGSHYTYNGRLSYGNKFTNGIDMALSGSIYSSQGRGRLYFKEFDSPATHNGVALYNDDDKNYSLFTKFSYSDFLIEGAYVSREKRIPTAPWGTIFNDSQNKTYDERAYVDLKYEHNFQNQTNLMGRISYDHAYYHGDYIYNYPPVTLNKDSGRGEWAGAELKLMKTLLKKHTVVLGTEYRYNFRQDQRNFDQDPYLEYLDDERDSKIWAFYFQDEFKILDNLIFNAGVRYDHYDTFGGTTNPRLALIYQPLDKTTLKLLYGEAFRAPNVYELHYKGGGIKANPGLDPETIRTYEMILEQSFGDHISVNVSGFYYTIKDLISQEMDSDKLQVYKNTDKIEAKGLELETNYKWVNGLEGRISYTFTETQDKKTDKILTNSPKNLAKFNLIVPLVKEKLLAGFEVQYTGKRKTLAGNFADDFMVTNLTLFSHNLLKGLEISGSIYNLFNKRFHDPGAVEHRQDTIEQDGRNFRLKITYTF